MDSSQGSDYDGSQEKEKLYESGNKLNLCVEKFCSIDSGLIYKHINLHQDFQYYFDDLIERFKVQNSKPNFYIFRTAFVAIVKLARVLAKPAGHILFSGFAGRGKFTLTKFVAFSLGYKFETIMFSTPASQKDSSVLGQANSNSAQSRGREAVAGEYVSKEKKRGGFGLKEGPESNENSGFNIDEELILRNFRTSILECLKNHYKNSIDQKMVIVIRIESLKFGTNFCGQVLSCLKHLIEYNDVTVLCDHIRDLKDFTS